MTTAQTGSSNIAAAGTVTTYFLDDMALYIEDNSTFVGGVDLFAGLLPDDLETTAVGIFEYSGGSPVYVMGEDQHLPAWSQPNLQVIVRTSAGYETGISTITALTTSLEMVVNQYINGTWYYRIARKQDPFLMDRDARRRVYMVCNFDVMRKAA